ncbi:MAG: DUF421 domain-containing protein [Solirubrobacterales bacterium]
MDELIPLLIGQKSDVTWWQMSVRAIVVFAYGVAIVRFAGHRIFGKARAFDVVLSVIVGSNLSRALTGNSEMGATLIATTAIVAIHWAVAHLAVRWHWLSRLAKGDVVRLMRGGELDRKAMNAVGLSRGDLEEAARSAHLAGAENVREAYLERSGKISVIPRE